MPMNEGARLLTAIVARGSATAVAARLGVTEGAARHYADGSRKPRAETRRRALDAFSIPVDAWEHPAREEKAAGKPAQTNATTTPLSAVGLSSRDRAVAIVERIEAEIAACDSTVPINHKAALYGQLQSAVTRLSKLDGDGEVTPAQVLRSKAWHELEAVLGRVLREFPGAAERLSGELAALTKGNGR